MSKVLLLCPEPLGHQHPAGVGIRFLEIARAVRAEGHDVTVLSRDGGSVPGCRSETASPHTIAAATAQNDLAIVQGHLANELFVHGSRIPTVVDLYDPFIVENLHYYSALGEQVYRHDHETLMRSLEEGDFFLCASADQRLFYLGVLLALGRLNPMTFRDDATLQSLLAIAPFGVPAPRQVPPKNPDAPRALFGGIYDWYEPEIAVEAVRIARRAVSQLTLTFTQHPNAELTPQSKYAQTMKSVERQPNDFVRSEQWVPYDQRSTFYDRFTVGLLTFKPSLETDLSMRTRIFDYLWAGLPVLTSSAPGTDAILQRYGAGRIVSSNRPEDFAAELVNLLSNQEEYQKSVAGTQRFAFDNQWSVHLEPLLQFCRAPRFDENKHRFERADTSQRDSIIERLKTRLRG